MATIGYGGKGGLEPKFWLRNLWMAPNVSKCFASKDLEAKTTSGLHSVSEVCGPRSKNHFVNLDRRNNCVTFSVKLRMHVVLEIKEKLVFKIFLWTNFLEKKKEYWEIYEVEYTAWNRTHQRYTQKLTVSVENIRRSQFTAICVAAPQLRKCLPH